MQFLNILKLLLLIIATAILPISANPQEAKPWLPWQSSMHKNHPLAGKIWSVREKRFVTTQILGKAVNAARFVLIGEVHDNADHHRLQAWLIEKTAQSRKPAVVMEMIAGDKAPALRDYLAMRQANAEGLGAALDWGARGWPDWKMYQPIAETALRLKLPIHAGDIDKPTLKSVGKKGLAVLGTKRRKTLLLDEPLDDPLQNALLDELFESHCNLVPRKAMRPMLNVQRLRDAVLAHSLITAAGNGSAIMIAGNGHVRADRAVPWYLSRRAPKAKIVTVMLLETDESVNKPEDISPATPDGKPAADYLWFTPRAQREDQCEALRKRFGK